MYEKNHLRIIYNKILSLLFGVDIFADVSTLADSMSRHKIAAHTRQYQSKHHHEHHYSGPFFEGPLNTSAGALNVGVHLYTEGVFDCRVGMLKDKTVSFKQIQNKFSLFLLDDVQ